MVIIFFGWPGFSSEHSDTLGEHPLPGGSHLDDRPFTNPNTFTRPNDNYFNSFGIDKPNHNQPFISNHKRPFKPNRPYNDRPFEPVGPDFGKPIPGVIEVNDGFGNDFVIVSSTGTKNQRPHTSVGDFERPVRQPVRPIRPGFLHPQEFDSRPAFDHHHRPKRPSFGTDFHSSATHFEPGRR